MSKKTAAKLLEIAKQNSLEIQNRGDLEVRRSDSEDFLEVSVWGLKAMLDAAYQLGKAGK
ncbi:DUF6900 domain-containing protein [Arcanobacterium buesumense]|uniref:DUF6900 domain-containing protein n=1 Tax=Arcanobacterium buesumense TaxID=2722751 RepID=A0A6H2EIB3_9ACTO|nr:hypothetical protein [Arcanobacterium buesumense]QJC21056.1 hypothetical protein HC352_02565 [Arcanobacterium buesumense]